MKKMEEDILQYFKKNGFMISEIVKIFGRNLNTMRSLVYTGIIESEKVGTERRVSFENLEKYLESRFEPEK